MDELRKQFPITTEAIAKKDNNIFVILGDISHGIFANFRKNFPKNYLNIGILEPTMISMSAGLSKAGVTPIVHTIAPFIIERSLEQLKLDYGYHKLNGNIITVGGSTTDQRYISEGFTFQDVLRDHLHKNGKEVSIVNAGIDGQSTYGHLQNFDYWFNKIPNLKTKYFLFFIGVNDFFVQSGPMGGDIHYHNVNNNVNQDLVKMIMSKSILYHFIKVLSGNITAYSYDLRHEVNMPFSEIVWTSKLKIDNHKDLMKTFLKDYEKRLTALLGRAKEYGAESIIVTQSSRRVYDNSNEILKGQKDYMKWGGKLINGTDYYYMINLLHERTEKVADQSGALFIDLNQNLNFDLENDFYDH